VSAVSASPAVGGGSPSDPVRALQHALYRAAKADPGRRFHSLRDKVFRRDVLWRAWVEVRRNGGAAGVDRTTLAMVEEYGVDRLLDEIAAELREGRYRPSAARRVFIPKPGSSERRSLSIPTVRDRVVQGSGRDGPRTTPCRCSSMSAGEVDAGWWRRISRTVSMRFRTRS
jgi:RNA-directed DNA polymerase